MNPDSALHLPLIVVVYENLLTFQYINLKTGVDWFGATGKKDPHPSKRYRASGAIAFLQKLASHFNVVVLMPKRTHYWLLETDYLKA